MQTIREITAEETITIRHTVMWPEKPVSYVVLPNDNEGLHYGYFIDDKLVSVISLFEYGGEIQFRKFATIKEHQGKGYGSLLLKEIMQIVKKKFISRIWCNARQNKSNFYAKFGMKETNETYVKGGIDFIIMERYF